VTMQTFLYARPVISRFQNTVAPIVSVGSYFAHHALLLHMPGIHCR